MYFYLTINLKNKILFFQSTEVDQIKPLKKSCFFCSFAETCFIKLFNLENSKKIPKIVENSNSKIN